MPFHWESKWRAGGLMSKVVCSKQNDNKLYEPRFYSEWCIRDRSLITGRGGYKIGKSLVRNFLRHPPPPCNGKTVCAPPPAPPLLFKGWKSFAPLFSMAKTSSSHVKTTSNRLCPPPTSAWLKHFQLSPL